MQQQHLVDFIHRLAWYFLILIKPIYNSTKLGLVIYEFVINQINDIVWTFIQQGLHMSINHEYHYSAWVEFWHMIISTVKPWVVPSINFLIVHVLIPSLQDSYPHLLYDPRTPTFFWSWKQLVCVCFILCWWCLSAFKW